MYGGAFGPTKKWRFGDVMTNGEEGCVNCVPGEGSGSPTNKR